MNDVHFFPLIDADTDGSMRVPMFSAASEAVVKSSSPLLPDGDSPDLLSSDVNTAVIQES